MNVLSKPSSIIVIQTSPVACLEADHYFDHHGIRRDEDYLLFSLLNEEAMAEIELGEPQFVFTSHIDGVFDAFKVASKVKGKNPRAIVIALTSSKIEGVAQPLDGVINKLHMKRSTPSEVAKAFLHHKPKNEVLAAIA